MLVVKPWKILQILVAVLLAWFLLVTYFRSTDPARWPKSVSYFSNELRDTALAHIENETLGVSFR